MPRLGGFCGSRSTTDLRSALAVVSAQWPDRGWVRAHVAVAEHERALFQVGTSNRRRLEGVPMDAVLESIAWQGGDRFALGTVSESSALDVDIQGSVDRVVGEILVPVPPSVRAVPDAGIEGLCASNGFLLAAVEPVERLPHGRFVGRQSLRPGYVRSTIGTRW